MHNHFSISPEAMKSIVIDRGKAPGNYHKGILILLGSGILLCSMFMIIM